MPLPSTITVATARDLPDDQRELLLLALRDYAEVQEAEPRDLAAAWVLFVAVMKDVGVVAGGAAALMTLAEKVKAWREQARSKGVEPKVRLERPGRAPLDLATAGDSELLDWFLDQPPAR